MLSRIHLQVRFFFIVYAFLTPQILDENTPIIYSQNILKKIAYSKISCDNTEFSSTFSSLLQKRDLIETVTNGLLLKRNSYPELRCKATAVTLPIQKTTVSYKPHV